MELAEKITLLKERFVHRSDVFALQWHQEGRGTGFRPERVGVCVEGCRKSDCTHVRNRPITDQDIKMHVLQRQTIGVYQLKENTITWICVDVDLKKGSTLDKDESLHRIKQHTMDLALRLHEAKIPFLVERSGGKGYHVWVFFSEPVEAVHGYSFGRWITGGFSPPEDITIEVFPKQHTTSAYGNLIKMPLGIHQKTKRTCIFVGADWKQKEGQWELLRDVRRLSRKELLSIIKTLDIPVVEVIPKQETGTVGKTTPICISRMLSEGLQEGHLDIGLFKLSCYFRDRGLPYDMAHAALETMGRRNASPSWFNGLMEAKLDSAYGRDYSPLPCSETLLDSYCSSSCQFFGRKANQRTGMKASEAAGVISRD